MHIKFLKDYKDYEEGKIVYVANPKNASKLIKKGIVEDVGECYQIRDLYVCDIVKAETFLGEVKRVEFVRKAIMELDGEVELHLHEVNTYKHALTGTEFIGANRVYDKYYFDGGNKLYVDEYNECKVCKFARFFFDKMLDNGWNNNTYLTKAQILELEKELNINNNKITSNERV